MAQPAIRNMLLGAVRDGQRVDVPQGERWKHVGIVDVVRIDDVYAVPDADDANTTDGAGTRWRESGVYADVTLSSGAAATDVPASFLVQDKVLWVALTMKTLSDAQKTTIRMIPGMERAHIGTAKQARTEVLEYVNTDPQRWAEVRGHMANALPNQADLFKKKLRASTWEDTKALVGGSGHYPPTRGMSVEGQKTMIMVAIHAAAARLHDRDMLSLGEPTFVWTKEDLVESEAAPKEEVMDPAAARRLFPATQASQPERAGPKADTARQPAVATNKQRS